MKEREKLIDRLEKDARPLSKLVCCATSGGAPLLIVHGITTGNKEQAISGAISLVSSFLALTIAHDFFRKPSQKVSSLEQGKEQEPTVIEAISGIFINEDNQILLVRRAPKRTYNAGTYDLIGGDILPGETPRQTLVRDVEGKLGVKLDEGVIETKGTKDIEAPNAVIKRHIFVFHIERDVPIDLDPKKYDSYGWYDKDQIEELNLTPGVREILTAAGFLEKKD